MLAAFTAETVLRAHRGFLDAAISGISTSPAELHWESTTCSYDPASDTTFDEFGAVLVDTNSGLQPLGYAGGLYDPDMGLVRFGARDYDPMTGRWTAKDPFVSTVEPLTCTST